MSVVRSRRDRVLIVANDSQLRLELSRILSSSGFAPMVADSAKNGLMSMSPPFPRAVVIDERIEGGIVPTMTEYLDRASSVAIVALLDTADDHDLRAFGAASCVPRSRAAFELVSTLRAAIDTPRGAPPPRPPPPAPPPPPPSSAPPVIEQQALIGLAADLRRHLNELEDEDYFSILDVPLDAGTIEIRKGFLRLAKQWHPSRYGLDAQDVRNSVGDIFIIIKRAYDALHDRKKRAHLAEQAREAREARAARMKPRGKPR